jgi:hypothetical protein
VFRSRTKSPKSQATADQVREPDEEPKGRDPQAPKGRPTPKRSEAEALRRAVVKPAASRKEAARRAREARRKAVTKQREALLTGDERHLPPRDKGPVRRFARDFVDVRWHVAEYFLPIAVVILVMSMLPSIQARNIALLLWLGVILGIVADSVLTSRRLKRALRERFPDENLRGATVYALMRTMQLRRMRLPRPQVGRGEAPR